MGKVYGYVRVSSKDQNEIRQLIAMRELNVKKSNIYIDKQSGKDFDRPQYKRLVERLQKDDLVYVKSIDRLGRDYREIQEQWRFLSLEKEADICVIDMPLLDTRRGKDLLGTFLSDIVLQVLSFVAESERNSIKQRQAEGIAAAKARGVKFGRPAHALPPGFDEVFRRWDRKEITATAAAGELGMPINTFTTKAYRYRDSIKASGRSQKRAV